MFNPYTKSELSTINCNKKMKGNGRLRGNAQGSSIARWKAHCRLPISDN